MKVSFNKVITKKWKSHIKMWIAKRHLHRWLLAKPYFKLLNSALLYFYCPERGAQV